MSTAEGFSLRDVAAIGPQRAHVLAVDLGTGGPKVALVDGRGRVVAHAFAPVPLHLSEGGGAEQDPHDWWNAIVSSAQRCLASTSVDPADIVGVGCTAQWVGTVAVDDQGESLGNAVIWMDSRGSDLIKSKISGPVSVLGYDVTKLSRWIRLTGGVPSPSGKDPAAHILWIREHWPDVARAARYFLEPVDFLNLKLCGRAVASFDSITVHWATDNRKIHDVRYDTKLMRWLDLDRAKLPDLVATGSVIGGLTPAAAGDLGLLAGTPVVTGTGDLHSAAVGSGAVEDFAGHLYIGTSSWISCHVPFKKTDPIRNVASIPAGVPGRYIVADEHETGGACITFLRENLLYPDDGLTLGRPDDDLTLINELAASVPVGSNGVMFTPWLNGERSPVDDHTIRAGFHNLSLSNTRADMVRSVFEGVALNSRWLLDAVEHFIKRPFGALSFIGGGANSDLWCQMHADALHRPIRQTAEPVLANVRGAGILTLVALGRLSLGQVASAVEIKATFEPDPVAGAVYDELYAEFTNLYKQNKAIHRRLNRQRLSGH